MTARVRRCGGAYRQMKRNTSLYAKKQKDRSKANRSFKEIMKEKAEKNDSVRNGS